MKDIVFTSVCFGDAHTNGGAYIKQQNRLKESISEIYPDANMRFWASKYDDLSNRPTGARTHFDSSYGFKVHAVKSCLEEGFKKIIWVDTAIIMKPGLETILEVLSGKGVMAGVDTNKLNTCTSDKCLNWIVKPKEYLNNLNLVAGSVYLFDFNHPKTQPFFDMWSKMEEDGLFGSAEEAHAENSISFVVRKQIDEQHLEMEFVGDVNDAYFVGAKVQVYDKNDNSCFGIIQSLDPEAKPFNRVVVKLQKSLSGFLLEGEVARWRGGFNSHRHDESCFSLCLDKFDMKPLLHSCIGYTNAANSVDQPFNYGIDVDGQPDQKIYPFHKCHDIKMGL